MAELLDPELWGRGTAADDADDARPPGPRRTGAISGSGVAAAAEATRAADATGAPSPSKPTRSRSPLPLILTAVLVVLLLAAGAVWAVVSGLLPSGEAQGGAAPENPAASAPAADAPEETGAPSDEPSDEPSPAVDPAGAALPASCDALFSGGMRATIESVPLALNPAWHEQSGDSRLPTDDDQLAAILAAAPRLDCVWLHPDGGGDVGIYTAVAQVTAEQTAAADARLGELGFTAIQELGSTRYITDRTIDGVTTGESHLLRDGLWFGTYWMNYGPTGYTADMVTQVLG